MNAAFLYTETVHRYAERELTNIEAVKLEFVCKNAILDYPHKNLEELVVIAKAHLRYIMNLPDIKIKT